MMTVMIYNAAILANYFKIKWRIPGWPHRAAVTAIAHQQFSIEARMLICGFYDHRIDDILQVV